MCFFYLHANYFDLSAKGLQLARCKEGLCSQRHVVHAVKTCLFFYIRFISVECQLDAQTLMSEMYITQNRTGVRFVHHNLTPTQ